MTDAPDRSGPNDLVTPFVFVPHGAPDPVAWKRAHPGWVSFPATFVPQKRPIPKWTVLNGKRWPLDKRGQPWPRSRFGQPMCPLDEFPPGMPAPGTQGRLIAEKAERLRQGVADITSGRVTTAEVLAEAARMRAEHAAQRPADPASPPVDRMDPSVRAYFATVAAMDASIRVMAEGARARTAALAEQARPSGQAVAEAGPTLAMALSAGADPSVPDSDLLTPVQSGPPGGRGPTRPRSGPYRNLTLPETARAIRFQNAVRRLREMEPNNPDLVTLSSPNAVPSEAWIARLEAELAAAIGRAQLGQPPRTIFSPGASKHRY